MSSVEEEVRRGGLTLAQLAGIDVALAEGHALAAVLEQEGVDAAAYRAADGAWRRELGHDAAQRSRFAELVAMAEDCQTRAVPPLDSEPQAWAAFLTAARRSGGTVAAGRALGLGRGDVSRLIRRWHARTSSDEALRETIRSLLGRVGAPADVRPETATLRPYPWSPGAGGGASPPACSFQPLQKLVLSLDGALPAERDVDVYAALVATSEAFPEELAHALELCGLLEGDWESLGSSWRERMQRDADARASFSARLADYRALSRELRTSR